MYHIDCRGCRLEGELAIHQAKVAYNHPGFFVGSSDVCRVVLLSIVCFFLLLVC